MPNKRPGATMTREAVNELIKRRVAEALEAHDAARNLEPLVESGGEQGDENGDDYEGGNGGGNRNRGGNKNGGVNRNRGNGNGGGNGNRNDNRNGNGHEGGNRYNFGGLMPVARECTYQDFLKCQPLNFNGMEGVVGLTRWFEKMETNSHKRAIGFKAAYGMKWTELMKLMTEVYCPRNEIQKMETELWNLTVKGNDLAAYTRRFQELVLLCTRMVPDEEDKVERFIGGLPDNIQGNVIAAEPTRLQDAIRVANNLMDQKLKEPQKPTQPGIVCYECGRPGHYRKDFPKLRNQNRRNKTGNKTVNNEATTKAYAIRGGGANLDSNVFTLCSFSITILCFYVIHSGATGVSVSSTISALLDVLHPSTLDTSLF
ncbi:putative reverse transcriptase domain-containing protein [Tanacetum coccineum]